MVREIESWILDIVGSVTSTLLMLVISSLNRAYNQLRLCGKRIRLMLYTRLASPVAVCMDIPRRYTWLARLANPNPNPTKPTYG